jgi:hypothetical protein
VPTHTACTGGYAYSAHLSLSCKTGCLAPWEGPPSVHPHAALVVNMHNAYIPATCVGNTFALLVCLCSALQCASWFATIRVAHTLGPFT